MSRRRFLVLGAVVALGAAAGFVAGQAAPARAEKPADDAPPVLLSTGGGGPKWTTLEQLKQFAAKGDALACFQLAELFQDGSSVPPDPKKAAEFFEKAARGGNANGWFRLGKIYHDGLGGPPDYGRALDCFTLAARAGVAEAQHNIGAMLASGRGVQRNYAEGLAWLIVSRKSGVGQDAEEQVRARLAKKPNDIKAAEARAAEILKDLAHAEVRAVRTSAAGNSPVRPPVDIREKISPPAAVAAPLEKTAITLDAPPKIALPVAPLLGEPKAPKEKR
ncbi:MAG: sel1 repeat family protein [Opitutae bacterium]|nr:sel1 repeat family protein [Opitutae bacterium]